MLLFSIIWQNSNCNICNTKLVIINLMRIEGVSSCWSIVLFFWRKEVMFVTFLLMYWVRNSWWLHNHTHHQEVSEPQEATKSRALKTWIPSLNRCQPIWEHIYNSILPSIHDAWLFLLIFLGGGSICWDNCSFLTHFTVISESACQCFLAYSLAALETILLLPMTRQR